MVTLFDEQVLVALRALEKEAGKSFCWRETLLLSQYRMGEVMPAARRLVRVASILPVEIL
jgi:hypothetical protein